MKGTYRISDQDRVSRESLSKEWIFKQKPEESSRDGGWQGEPA